VYRGDLVSVIGKVKSFEANGARVVFTPTNLEGYDDDLVVEVDCCHKYFTLGDAVTVVEGKYRGESAMIMSLDEKDASKPLCKIEGKNIEIKINTRCLKLRSHQETATVAGVPGGNAKMSSYKVGDLITYDDSKVYA
jgi:hypothetical protein